MFNMSIIFCLQINTIFLDLISLYLFYIFLLRSFLSFQHNNLILTPIPPNILANCLNLNHFHLLLLIHPLIFIVNPHSKTQQQYKVYPQQQMHHPTFLTTPARILIIFHIFIPSLPNILYDFIAIQFLRLYRIAFIHFTSSKNIYDNHLFVNLTITYKFDILTPHPLISTPPSLFLNSPIEMEVTLFLLFLFITLSVQCSFEQTSKWFYQRIIQRSLSNHVPFFFGLELSKNYSTILQAKTSERTLAPIAIAWKCLPHSTAVKSL